MQFTPWHAVLGVQQATSLPVCGVLNFGKKYRVGMVLTVLTIEEFGMLSFET